MYDAAAEQQLMATSKYGARLTCPGCRGEDFHIYSTPVEMVVECKNSQCQCQGAVTFLISAGVIFSIFLMSFQLLKWK